MVSSVQCVTGDQVTDQTDFWVCTVVPDMKLSPNVGSDRSWVWNATADVSEGEPEAQTLAIRFANSDSKSIHHAGVRYYQLTMCRRERLQGGIHQGPAGERGSLRQIIDVMLCSRCWPHTPDDQARARR